MIYIGGYLINMAAFWLVVMILLLIIEAVVPGLVSIWFAIGALAALIAAMTGGQLWLQVLWFLAVSVLTLALTRPLVKKYVNSRTQPTNADALIGMECLITEDIDNVLGTGTAKVNGRDWTARAEDEGVKLKKGDRAKIVRIEGVKLIVNTAERQ